MLPFGSTGYIEKLWRVNGYVVNWGDPMSGKILIATLARKGVDLHKSVHADGCSSPGRIQHFAVDRHNLPNMVFTNGYGNAQNEIARD